MTRTWKEILADRWEGVDGLYGPHSHEVWSAVEYFSETKWFAHVGAPIEPNAGVVQVSGWKDACSIFARFAKGPNGPYDMFGHLAAAVELVHPVTTDPIEGAWWQEARNEAANRAIFSAHTPKAIEESLFEVPLLKYLFEHMSWALAEIIGSAHVSSTYFREQLQWFSAGHFPCGWEGSWPSGRMRVF